MKSTKINPLKPMGIGELARCYGWTVPMLKNILKKLDFNSIYVTVDKSAPRKLSPQFIDEVCKAIGDPEHRMDFKKTTYSSLAKEFGIARKTLHKQIETENMIDELEKCNNYYLMKVLLPSQVRLIRTRLGYKEKIEEKT